MTTSDKQARPATKQPKPDCDLKRLTPGQVVDCTGRNITTVYLALQSGELHGHQGHGKFSSWNVHPNAVDAWLYGGDGEAVCPCPPRVVKFRRRSTG